VFALPSPLPVAVAVADAFALPLADAGAASVVLALPLPPVHAVADVFALPLLFADAVAAQVAPPDSLVDVDAARHKSASRQRNARDALNGDDRLADASPVQGDRSIDCL
jgi:hypothetical protein